MPPVVGQEVRGACRDRRLQDRAILGGKIDPLRKADQQIIANVDTEQEPRQAFTLMGFRKVPPGLLNRIARRDYADIRNGPNACGLRF